MKKNSGIGLMITDMLVLFLASGSAIYGIWTQPQVDTRTALVSSIIAVFGVIFAIASAVWKFKDTKIQEMLAEQKERNGFQVMLTSSSLIDLKIVWSFKNIPGEVNDVITLGNMIVDTRFLLDEEIDRFPQDLRSKVSGAWFLEKAINPLVETIVSGKLNPENYPGEYINEAIERWRANDGTWQNESGTAIDYEGPTHEIIFPLNTNLNAALSLGKKSVTEKVTEAIYGWQQDFPDLHELTDYTFNVYAKNVKDRLSIEWSYDLKSLQKEVVKDEGIMLYGGLPSEFCFLVIHTAIERDDYLTKAARHFFDRDLFSRPADKQWNNNSTLEVYINGLNAHYTFDVVAGSRTTHTTHVGAYDNPVEDFDYTPYYCTLRSLS